MQDRLKTYNRFVKIEHTLFSFPLLLSGALLAAEALTWRVLLLILVAGTGARTAALGTNRILDRAIDRRNPRTAGRELPSGQMTLAEASLVTGIGAAVYLGAAFAISPKCLLFSPIPLIIFVLYPLMKRFTMWAHLGVGAALAMSPLGAWYAVQLDFHDYPHVLLLCLFTLFWVAGFDIIYATLDVDFDQRDGLYSLPSRLGKKSALAISFAFHVVAFLLLGALYWTAMERSLAVVFLVGIAVLLLLEHRKAASVELAFFKINAAIGFLVLGFVWAGVGLVS